MAKDNPKPKLFYSEDFSNYEIGDFPTEWGKNLSVLYKKEIGKYLTTQTPESRFTASQRVDFPQDFIFEFSYSSGTTYFTLIDSKGDELKSELWVSGNGRYGTINLPGLGNPRANLAGVNIFKLIKSGFIYKAYLNGNFVCSATYTQYSNFVEFRIQVTSNSVFTNFRGEILGNSQHMSSSGIKENDISDVDVKFSKAVNPDENKFAIIIGIEEYKKVPIVQFAKQDALSFKEYAINLFGVRDNKSNLYFITDKEATKAEFEILFSTGGWLSNRVNENSDVYIYFAGHGIPELKDKSPYLLPYDGDSDYPTLTALPLKWLCDELSKLDVKSVTIFIDACFSGRTRDDKMIYADARPIYITVENPEFQSNKLTLFTSSSGNQLSSSYSVKGHGLFTYYLLKGLRQDGDLNNDHKLTVEEMEQYLKSNVSKTAGILDREQTPQVISNNKARTLLTYPNE